MPRHIHVGGLICRPTHDAAFCYGRRHVRLNCEGRENTLQASAAYLLAPAEHQCIRWCQ